MRHGIQESEWAEYLGGTMEAARAEKLRAHLDGCPECAAAVREQLDWHERVSKEAARVRWAMQPPEEDMADLLERTLARTREAPAIPLQRRTAMESMVLMQCFMEPIFGAGTARMAMELAVRRSTQGNLENSDWPLFVTNLSEAVAAFCGSTAGRLVSSAGVCLAAGGR
jgi:anti-sigma factor RsiW